MTVKLVGPAPARADDAATKQYVDTNDAAARQYADAGDTAVRQYVAAALAPRITQVVVDFGDPVPGGQDETTAYGTGFAAWVTAGSVITCTPAPAGTDDHGAEDFVVEGVQVAVTYLEPGIGFDLIAAAPAGTWGRYLINCVG